MEGFLAVVSRSEVSIKRNHAVVEVKSDVPKVPHKVGPQNAVYMLGTGQQGFKLMEHDGLRRSKLHAEIPAGDNKFQFYVFVNIHRRDDGTGIQYEAAFALRS